MRSLRFLLPLLKTVAVLTRVTAIPTTSVAHNNADTVIKHCRLPSPGGTFEAAAAEDVNLDPDIVREAIEYATAAAGRISVQIFRNNCRVAEGPLDPLTDGVKGNVFSATKSVASMIAGLAYDRSLLALDDPIGKFLPPGLGWGDEAHRAITVEQLLVQASGLDEAVLSEAATFGLDASAPREALAQPIKYPPGSRFEYSERAPDLLNFIVQQAVGEDFQEFAQKNLFDPIGIANNTFFWLRDRTGNTYGYSGLYIRPTDLAKLGLVMQNSGSWNGQQILSPNWVDMVSQSSARNPCYGFLFWTNRGKSCTGANFPSAQTYNRQLIPSAPDDLYAMVGAVMQSNFMIPSLGMTVTWTGIVSDLEPNLAALLDSAGGADQFHNFFRILMRAVKDVHIPDPGPFRIDPLDLDINPNNYLSPSVLLKDVSPLPDCNIIFCGSGTPGNDTLEGLQKGFNLLRGLARKTSPGFVA